MRELLTSKKEMGVAKKNFHTDLIPWRLDSLFFFLMAHLLLLNINNLSTLVAAAAATFQVFLLCGGDAAVPGVGAAGGNRRQRP